MKYLALLLAFACLPFAACTSSIGGSGGSGGTASCATDTDCGTNRVCGFAESDGCAAKGQCFAACPAWSSGRLRLGGCVGLAGGAIAGDYVKLIEGASHARPLFLATVLPFASVRLVGPVWARAEAGAWFPLLRERWGYLDARGVFEEVFRPAPVVPAATLTLEVRAGS